MIGCVLNALPTDRHGVSLLRHGQESLIFFVGAGFGADALDPNVGLLIGGGLKAIVLGRRENAEDVLSVGPRGSNGRDRRHLGQGNGGPETSRVFVLVYG